MNEIHFIVDQAGCTSCAELLNKALAPIAEVRGIDVDEGADRAAVRVTFSPDLSQEAVSGALLNASTAAGHDYRVQPGSWRYKSSD